MLTELLRSFGPFSRIGSLVNVVISSAITVANISFSTSDFERVGWVGWGVFMAVVFVTIAVVVWVRSFRASSSLRDRDDLGG